VLPISIQSLARQRIAVALASPRNENFVWPFQSSKVLDRQYVKILAHRCPANIIPPEGNVSIEAASNFGTKQPGEILRLFGRIVLALTNYGGGQHIAVPVFAYHPIALYPDRCVMGAGNPAVFI
jgi:hypothetical protein